MLVVKTSVKKYFILIFVLFSLMYPGTVISKPEKVIAKFMATLLGFGSTASDFMYKVEIPEDVRKKMIEDGTTDPDKQVEKYLVNLYETLGDRTNKRYLKGHFRDKRDISTHQVGISHTFKL